MVPQAEARRRDGGFLRANLDPVKLTALLYLKEALLAERYEECAEFVSTAREFGAQEREIQSILENPAGALNFKKIARAA